MISAIHHIRNRRGTEMGIKIHFPRAMPMTFGQTAPPARHSAGQPAMLP